MDKIMDEARDEAPLLLATLLDRGALVQADNLVVTKTRAGYAVSTWKDHLARSLRLASALENWGARLGDRIATLVWTNAWHMECTHAVSCMGCVLHTLNARLSPTDLGFTLTDAEDRVVIVDASLLEVLGGVDPTVLQRVELFVCCGEDGVAGEWTLPRALASAPVQDYEAFLSAGSAGYRWPRMPESTPHALTYTSGSTGAPKGVVYSHRSTYLALLTMGLADQFGISGEMVVSSAVPMFHILSWGVPLLAAMLGARLILPGRYTHSEDLLEIIETWGVQWFAGVPAVWQAMREALRKRDPDEVRARFKLRKALAGGSAPSYTVMEWYRQNFGLEFMQGWGMTETNPLGTNAKYISTYRDLAKTTDERHANLKNAGLPVPGFEFRIADPNDFSKDVPRGGEGEFLCRGPFVVTRYFGGQAPEKFYEGWCVTGDIAKVDEEGIIVICDRKKDFIKSGGEWVSSAALESSIAELDWVDMVAVVGVLHPRWDERPIAVVTAAEGAVAPTRRQRLADVRAHCAREFARFQLPDDVLRWEQMPLNSTGKVDKLAIRERLTREGYVLPELFEQQAKL